MSVKQKTGLSAAIIAIVIGVLVMIVFIIMIATKGALFYGMDWDGVNMWNEDFNVFFVILSYLFIPFFIAITAIGGVFCGKRNAKGLAIALLVLLGILTVFFTVIFYAISEYSSLWADAEGHYAHYKINGFGVFLAVFTFLTCLAALALLITFLALDRRAAAVERGGSVAHTAAPAQPVSFVSVRPAPAAVTVPTVTVPIVVVNEQADTDEKAALIKKMNEGRISETEFDKLIALML